MKSSSEHGLVDLPSGHRVDEIVKRIRRLLTEKRIALFALVDHSGEAEKVGIQMRPTKLFVFGNPEAGTPLMLASPSSAIDLSLKILVWEDEDGKVWVTYNSPAYLLERHNLPLELVSNIAVVEAIAKKVADP